MSYGRNLVHGERTSQNRVGPYRFCSGGTPPHLSSKSFFGFLRVYMDVYLLLKVLSSGHVQVHGSYRNKGTAVLFLRQSENGAGSELEELLLSDWGAGAVWVLQSTTTYYSVLQSTTPVLLRTTKYYSSTTPYYSSTTPVLLRTTKYYSSTTPYYKVLLQYYSVLLQYCSSTTLYYKVLLQYYSVLLQYCSSTTLYYKVLLQYYSVLLQYCSSTTLYYSSTTLYFKVLLQYYPVLHITTTLLIGILFAVGTHLQSKFAIGIVRPLKVTIHEWGTGFPGPFFEF